MSLNELEAAVTQLPPSELSQFRSWFEEFQSDRWDQQIAQDATEGRLDALIRQADQHFEASHRKKPRPYALAAGEFVVPDDFDAPLPEEILRDFEGG